MGPQYPLGFFFQNPQFLFFFSLFLKKLQKKKVDVWIFFFVGFLKPGRRKGLGCFVLIGPFFFAFFVIFSIGPIKLFG